MYLELSARQTGKTARLVEQLEYDLRSGRYNGAVVIGYKNRHSKQLQRLVHPALRHKVIPHPTAQRLEALYIPSQEFRVYYDEFCFTEKRYLKVIDPDGYYVSTPNGRQVVDDLITYNNGKYETRTHHDKDYDLWLGHMDSQSIDREYTLETFYKCYPNRKREVVPPELFQM